MNIAIKNNMADVEKKTAVPRIEPKSSVILIIAVAAIYFIAARLSLLLAMGNSNATAVWPPSGIALAAILIWGYRLGPAIFFGAFFANILALKGIVNAPAYYIIASFSTAAGNMLEGIAGVYLIRRFTMTGNPFENIKDLFIFISLGSLASTMISATTGVSSYCLMTGDFLQFFSLWITWWLGDAAGILIVSPVIIMLKYKTLVRPGRSAIIEAGFASFILIISSFLIFWNNYHLDYLIIPILLWIALRFNRFEAAAAVFIVSGITIASTISGIGPVTAASLNTSLLYLQSYIGIISIITLFLSVLTYERGKSEKLRSDVQKQLYDIIEFLPDATFAINRDGRVIAWNRAIEELSGISKKEMIGKGDYSYAMPFFGEPRPILIDLVMKPPDAASMSAYDYIVQRKTILVAERYNPLLDRHLSGAASVLIDNDGNIYGAIESIRDISDRKTAELDLKRYKENLEEIVKERSASLLQANEQLTREIEERARAEKAHRESESKYRDLVESANSVILRWRPDGTITFINSFAQIFFGYSEAEIMGRNIMGTIVPSRESSSGRDLSLLVENIVRDPESHVFNENENIRKNGELVWIAWTNRPIMNEWGTVKEILSVGNDITARKRAEESLQKILSELAVAKDRAEDADRLKSAFLANMSHELRTPLNSIIGFTGIILQELVGPVNGEQKKQLEMVKNSANHLLALINDILDLSKIEAGQMTIAIEYVNLFTTIEKSLETVRPQIEKKGLSLIVDLEPILSMEIEGDKRRIEQILLNLLSNAIKYSESGTITVKAEKSGTSVQITVSDNGIGIKGADLEKLFKPFQQLDTGISRKYEGTGLGLSICKRLVELLGGRIWAESVVGQGSSFHFTLPIRERR